MELLQAYELTMAKVNALRQSGIQVSLTIPQSINNENLVAKITAEGGLPSDKWVRISFQNLTDEQEKAVFESGNYLGKYGITFDCGGSKRLRDWEIDWSFQCDKSKVDGWLESRSKMEGAMDSVNPNNLD